MVNSAAIAISARCHLLLPSTSVLLLCAIASTPLAAPAMPPMRDDVYYRAASSIMSNAPASARGALPIGIYIHLFFSSIFFASVYCRRCHAVSPAPDSPGNFNGSREGLHDLPLISSDFIHYEPRSLMISALSADEPGSAKRARYRRRLHMVRSFKRRRFAAPCARSLFKFTLSAI